MKYMIFKQYNKYCILHYQIIREIMELEEVCCALLMTLESGLG